MADCAPTVTRIALALLRASRASRALLLLGALLLGSALHGLHHLHDPGCADGVERGHACTVCASLHGSTLAVAESEAPKPDATEWSPAAAAIVAAPPAVTHASASPRAPPAN